MNAGIEFNDLAESVRERLKELSFGAQKERFSSPGIIPILNIIVFCANDAAFKSLKCDSHLPELVEDSQEASIVLEM